MKVLFIVVLYFLYQLIVLIHRFHHSFRPTATKHLYPKWL